MGLQNEYDYIIIDSPPIFVVSDSIPLMEIVDLNIYILRQNYTKRELLNYANSFYDSEKIKNISLILNDMTFLITMLITMVTDMVITTVIIMVQVIMMKTNENL